MENITHEKTQYNKDRQFTLHYIYNYRMRLKQNAITFFKFIMQH